MINHLRTLLLNEERDPLAEFEEYIPENYRPVDLDFACATIRTLLIRPDWPREYRNFVATLLAGIAADSPYAYLLNKLDQRSSIDFKTNLVSSLQDRVILERVTNANSLQVVGTYHSNLDLGIFRGKWELKNLSSSSVEVLDTRTRMRRTVVVDFTGDTTRLFAVELGNKLNFQFVGASSVPDFRATISAQNAPYYDVPSALARLQSSDQARGIFARTSNTSVLRQMGGEFENARRPEHKLAAILVAYAYQADFFI